VQGDLTLSVAEDVTIGYKKGKSYVLGGKIEANTFSAIGTADLALLADVKANEVFIECNVAEIQGAVGDDTVTMTLKVIEANVSGAVAGKIELSDTTTLYLSNNAASVKGGQKVKVTSGKVGIIEKTQTLYVYECADVDMILNVTDYYRVTTLATPAQVLVVNEDNEFFCYVPEIIGATHIAYSVNDSEKAAQAVTPGATTRFKIEGITPGKQVLKLRAIAQNDERYLDSDTYEVTFDFAVKIDAPVVDTPVESDGRVEIVVHPVRYAEKVTYTIDGTSQTVAYPGNEELLHIDITDSVQAGGVHTIKVVAKSDNEYFTDSNEVLTSYVKYVTLEAPVVTVTKNGNENVTFTWSAIEGRTDYHVIYGQYNIYTKSTTLTLPYEENQFFTVAAIGGDYYKDGMPTFVMHETIVALFSPEDPGTDGDGTGSDS